MTAAVPSALGPLKTWRLKRCFHVRTPHFHAWNLELNRVFFSIQPAQPHQNQDDEPFKLDSSKLKEELSAFLDRQNNLSQLAREMPDYAPALAKSTKTERERYAVVRPLLCTYGVCGAADTIESGLVRAWIYRHSRKATMYCKRKKNALAV